MCLQIQIIIRRRRRRRRLSGGPCGPGWIPFAHRPSLIPNQIWRDRWHFSSASWESASTRIILIFIYWFAIQFENIFIHISLHTKIMIANILCYFKPSLAPIAVFIMTGQRNNCGIINNARNNQIGRNIYIKYTMYFSFS